MNIYKISSRTMPLFLAFLISFSLSAQNLENSLLWKVEKENIKPSYIFGTFHLLSKNDFEMKSKVMNAFHTSEQLVMELNLGNPGLQMEMMMHMAMKDGMTLDKLIDSVNYKKLDEAVKDAIGMGVMMFNTFKPMMVGTFLILNYIEGEPASLEMTLTSMAKEREMPIFGLETIEYQLSIFDEIPYEDQVIDLMEMVNDTKKMQALYADMVANYKDENINALYHLTVEDAGSKKELEFLLFKRNREWVKKVEELSRDHATFYAVGAAHLGGKEGMIKLLEKEGYKVTPIL